MQPTATSPPDFLQGVIAPMLTPVHADLSLDLDGAREFTRRLASRGCVRTIFARSGMGQMFTFTMDEARRLADTVLEAAGGRAGVVVGAGGEWRERQADRARRPDSARYLAQAVELTRYLHDAGADAAVHVLPEALTPEKGEPVSEAVYRYVRAVHGSAEIPIVLYQPGGLAPEYCMTPDLLRRLLDLPRLAGMKVSTGDDAVFGPIADTARGTGFALIAGNERYYLRALEQGAVGVIGEGCNVYPEILDALRRRFLAGDRAGAQEAQADVDRALDSKAGLDGNATWKAVLMHRGVGIQPYDRNGARPASQGDARRVAAAVDAILDRYEHARA